MEIMGHLFNKAHNYLSTVPTGEVFVEIGSDRWEGSTEYFAELANNFNTVLHSVDHTDEASQRLGNLQGVVWHIVSGGVWTKDIFPLLNKKISCLYLDNFDYNWDVNEQSSMIEQQKIEYKTKFNVDMNNQTCQVEHMTQMLNLFPYMSETGVIIVDDTYQVNDCWIGKCGPVVIFLLANGYTILESEDHGVILKKLNHNGRNT